MENAKASKPRDGFIPNPKLRLLDQVSEVMRFKHYSIRTERSYREWIKRFILFHGKRHPRETGSALFASCLLRSKRDRSTDPPRSRNGCRHSLGTIHILLEHPPQCQVHVKTGAPTRIGAAAFRLNG